MPKTEAFAKAKSFHYDQGEPEVTRKHCPLSWGRERKHLRRKEIENTFLTSKNVNRVPQYMS